MSFLIVDLSSAVVSLRVAFCYDEVFPSLVEVGLIDSLDVDSLGRERMLSS